MNRMLSNKKSIAIFLLPALAVFTVVVIVTVGASIWFSFLDWDGIGEASFIGFDNYRNIFTDKIFLKAIKNSLVLLVANIGLQLPVAVFLALLISSGMRGEKIYRTIYFIPVIIMTAVTGQLWIKLYDPVNGLLNQLLGLLGLETLQKNWLVDKKTVMMAVAVPGVWQWMGYHMLIVYSAVKSLSRDIYESAQIDGANKFRIAWNITLPNIIPMIKVSVTFMVVGSMKAFDLIYILTEGGPIHASEVPTITMYKTIFSKYRYGEGSAMAIVIVVICLVYALSVDKIFKKAEDRLE